MLRSVRYGLHGAVLAGLVALPTLWNTVDKTIDLVVDGHPHTVHTTAQHVSDVLAGEGYRITSHDLVAPSPSSDVEDGTRIVFRRGRLLHLDVNGARTDVWTTAPTVAEALAELGYSSSDFVSVSRSRRLPLGATDIAIRTPRLITIVHDGQREQVTTTEPTIGQVLDDIGVTLSRHDRVSVPLDSAVRAGDTVRIQRVDRRVVTRIDQVPFRVVKRQDPTLLSGTTKIVQPGKKGRERNTYVMIYVDGKLAGKSLVKSVIITQPVREILRVGTRQLPYAPSAPAPSPGTAKAIARNLVADRGWGNGQYNCLVVLWDYESSWNVHATNPSTGAYGIPQALPGSKMSVAGPDWENNATTQIKWGLSYIAERYGTPCGAWSFWQANGWY